MPKTYATPAFDTPYRDLKPGTSTTDAVGGIDFAIFANIHPGASAGSRQRFCVTCKLCGRVVHKDTIKPRYFITAHLSEKHPIIPG